MIVTIRSRTSVRIGHTIPIFRDVHTHRKPNTARAPRESARDALINGRWDAIGELLDGAKDVDAVAGKLPYMAA
jgi:hypothetical protein